MNDTNILDEYNNTVIIHTKKDFIKMREAGKLASQVLDFITPFVKEKISMLLF